MFMFYIEVKTRSENTKNSSKPARPTQPVSAKPKPSRPSVSPGSEGLGDKPKSVRVPGRPTGNSAAAKPPGRPVTPVKLREEVVKPSEPSAPIVDLLNSIEDEVMVSTSPSNPVSEVEPSNFDLLMGTADDSTAETAFVG